MDDGNVDKEAVEKLLLQIIKKAPPLVAALKKNCIDGDLERFGPPGVCKVIKLKKCIQSQAINVSFIYFTQYYRRWVVLQAVQPLSVFCCISRT